MENECCLFQARTAYILVSGLQFKLFHKKLTSLIIFVKYNENIISSLNFDLNFGCRLDVSDPSPNSNSRIVSNKCEKRHLKASLLHFQKHIYHNHPSENFMLCNFENCFDIFVFAFMWFPCFVIM